MTAQRNWGRWGAEDERGAPNAISAASLVAAAGLVRTGVVLSLGQLIEADTPVPHGKVAPTHFMNRDGGDYLAGGTLLGRSQYSEDTIMLGTHAGTHIDSLAHVWYDEQLYNGFPQSEVRSLGAKRCGVDKVGPIVARGVLFDIAATHTLDAGDVVDAAMLEACAVDVRAGDVAIVRTGWLERTGDNPARYCAGEPGLDVSGAGWLAERDVLAVGADNYAVEALRTANDGFPVHELLLRDCGIPMIEGLVLGELAAAAPPEFLFVAVPLRIRGGTASPLNPVVMF